jgi:nitroreductase
MTVSELIRTKRAVRQFTDEPLADEAIRSILHAGRRAQSSKNTQPWHFIAIRDRATLRGLAECGVYAGQVRPVARRPSVPLDYLYTYSSNYRTPVLSLWPRRTVTLAIAAY